MIEIAVHDPADGGVKAACVGERLCELPLLVIEAAQTAFQGGVVGGSNLFQLEKLLLCFEIGLQRLSGLLLFIVDIAQGNPSIKNI